MSSVGYGLLKSLIDSELPFTTLSNQFIEEDSFIDKEIVAYSFIKQFILDYGVHPRLDTIAMNVGEPDTFTNLTDEPIEYWMAEVKKRKRYADIRDCMIEMRKCIEDQKIDEAVDLMGSSYLKIRETYETKRIEDLRDVQLEVIEDHDSAQMSPNLPGIPFGFPYVDSVSGGAQGGDYIVIVGSTGVGKTFLALKCAREAYRRGMNVIVLSTEMRNLQIARRVLAMEGRFSATDFKMGRLSYYGRERAGRIIEEGTVLDGERGNYFHLLPGGMFPKVEDIAIVVKELKPDYLVIDGAYLLLSSAKGWWEKNMEVAMTLKNLSMIENIPTLATYQYLKKDVGKVEGVGGGFSIPQIASTVLSFEYERLEDVGSFNEVQYRVLKLVKGRDGESGSIRVLYNMRTTQILQDRRITGRLLEEDELAEPDLSREVDPMDYAEI